MFDVLASVAASVAVSAIYEVVLKLYETTYMRRVAGSASNDISEAELRDAVLQANDANSRLVSTLLQEIRAKTGKEIVELDKAEVDKLISELSRLALERLKADLNYDLHLGDDAINELRQKAPLRVNRYFNPPHEIPAIGRSLTKGSFNDLMAQLQEGEALFGLYTNQVQALVATHLDSEGRMTEMEELYAPSNGYYAVPIVKANKGLDYPIPI